MMAQVPVKMTSNDDFMQKPTFTEKFRSQNPQKVFRSSSNDDMFRRKDVNRMTALESKKVSFVPQMKQTIANQNKVNSSEAHTQKMNLNR